MNQIKEIILVFSHLISFVWCLRHITCRGVHMNFNHPLNVERQQSPTTKSQRSQRRRAKIEFLHFWANYGIYSMTRWLTILFRGIKCITTRLQSIIKTGSALKYCRDISNTVNSTASCVSWICINVTFCQIATYSVGCYVDVLSSSLSLSVHWLTWHSLSRWPWSWNSPQTAPRGTTFVAAPESRPKGAV